MQINNMKRFEKLDLFFICFLNTTVCLCLKTSLKFEVIADWGGAPFFPYKTFVELAVGREMAMLASKLEIDAVLALGDNFYMDGVKDVDDPRFKETFETAFNYQSLGVPWLVVAGNHDYYGNASAQIAYTRKSSRWHFPEFYYLKSYKVPASNMTVDIVMMDTVILCGNTDPQRPEEQPVLDCVNARNSLTHWKWLEKTLHSSRANYLLVCGHYPVYSIATHGPTDCLVKKLRPLMKKNNVTAYFSGHDHNLQHIHVQPSEDYFVTGSTNFIDPSKKNANKIPPNSLAFHWGDMFSLGAFTYVDINAANMTVTFIRSNGKNLYTYSKGPRFM
ncbi:hypothetical protein JTE90_001726 [Oedothorax gibbosus]|uniref:Tartrate-resistant acid phosphatase type 5 n=1 Tax=Oedothorax gibbosus TaxID=931172 RepID=A0AAV6TXY9_9ARAC|nr:hypothetical protein JTE90_001726 [Oedothorax gibbosus]